MRMGRIAALGALVVAIVLIAVVLLRGGDDYTVTANFQNASQLVTGNQVEVAGVAMGSIKKIELADDGTALVEMSIEPDYAPLHQGVIATIRSQSLSGLANRYISLQMPEGDEVGPEIPDGGELPLSQTVSEVDLDQLFNTLDRETVGNFKKVIKGFDTSTRGVGPQTNETFRYMNPFLSTSRQVFSELSSDEANLDRFIVDTATLTENLSERSDDLTGFIRNTNQMMGAIAAENTSLTATLDRLPGFMRNFNTTAVNLRATLDDLDPLVQASIPVALKLQPFMQSLRGFAIDAVPTVRALDATVSRPGDNNDLIELTRLQPQLAEIAVGPVRRNGARRPGALPVSTSAMQRSMPQLSFFRPYTPDLVGWFDDFGHSGVYDANGGLGRISTTFNAYTISPTTGLPDLFCGLISTVPGTPPPAICPGGGAPTPGAPSGPDEFFANGLVENQLEKCPGSNERDPGDNSTPFTDGGAIDCDPTEVPPGP